MTPEEEGIYIRLVARMYASGGPLPSDRTALAHLCGVRPQVMRRVLSTLLEMGKFDETGGKLRSNRCETELKLARNRIEQARFAASQPRKTNKLPLAGDTLPSKANHQHQPPIYSEAKASAADAALAQNGHDDPAAELFTVGVRILTRRGVPEVQARKILGKHRGEIKDDGKLLAILVSVERNNPVEPIGYLAKAVRQSAKPEIAPFSSPGFA